MNRENIKKSNDNIDKIERLERIVNRLKSEKKAAIFYLFYRGDRDHCDLKIDINNEMLEVFSVLLIQKYTKEIEELTEQTDELLSD